MANPLWLYRAVTNTTYIGSSVQTVWNQFDTKKAEL